MCRFLSTILVGTTLSLTCAYSQEPPTWPRTGYFLLFQSSVEKELKLTPEQKAKLEAIQKEKKNVDGQSLLSLENRRQLLNKLYYTAIGNVIQPQQQTRLKQIYFQIEFKLSGILIFRQFHVTEKLVLTQVQQKKVNEILKKYFEAEARLKKRYVGRTKTRADRLLKLRQQYAAHVGRILTDEQKEKWKEQIGKAFRGRITLALEMPLP